MASKDRLGQIWAMMLVTQIVGVIIAPIENSHSANSNTTIVAPKSY